MFFLLSRIVFGIRGSSDTVLMIRSVFNPRAFLAAQMNDKCKLLDAIENYLNFDVEMDYMAVFSSLCSSEDSSVRCASKLLCYISSIEYPDFRREIAVRNLVEDVKSSLENGKPLDDFILALKIKNDPKVRNLFERANQEIIAIRWFVFLVVTTFIVVAIILRFGRWIS